MMIILLLILIPVFTMGISVFSVSLYDIICNEYSLLLLISSSLCIIVSGFILVRVLFKFFDSKNLVYLNVKRNAYLISFYIIYILAFLVSLAFSIKVLFNDFSLLEKYLSVVISLVFLYFVFEYFFKYKKTKIKVLKITKVNKDINKLTLENNTVYFVDSSKDYEENKDYTFKINKYTKVINRK